MTVVENDRHEFFAVVRGADLRDFPDIPIVLRPLIDTSLHRLANETDPQWCLSIRHRRRTLGHCRPKIRIYAEGRSSPSLNVLVQSRAKFESLAEVMGELRRGLWQLSPVQLPARVSFADDTATLKNMNDKNEDRLSRMRPRLVAPAKTNVVDFMAWLHSTREASDHQSCSVVSGSG